METGDGVDINGLDTGLQRDLKGTSKRLATDGAYGETTKTTVRACSLSPGNVLYVYSVTVCRLKQPLGHNLAMKALTPRQQEILDLIRRHIDQTGFPPTRMDICNALGFKSPNAAEEHLRALERKGMVELSSGTSRGIRLLGEKLAADLMGIPLVGRVAAGQPILAQEHIEARYALDSALFAQTPDYFLKVRGMSMRDAGILEDDLLAVKKLADGGSSVRNGQIVVARIENDVTVKRFQRDGRNIVLLPENPDFQPIVVTPHQEDFVLEGLGIGVIRNPKVLS